MAEPLGREVVAALEQERPVEGQRQRADLVDGAKAGQVDENDCGWLQRRCERDGGVFGQAAERRRKGVAARQTRSPALHAVDATAARRPSLRYRADLSSFTALSAGFARWWFRGRPSARRRSGVPRHAAALISGPSILRPASTHSPVHALRLEVRLRVRTGASTRRSRSPSPLGCRPRRRQSTSRRTEPFVVFASIAPLSWRPVTGRCRTRP